MEKIIFNTPKNSKCYRRFDTHILNRQVIKTPRGIEDSPFVQYLDIFKNGYLPNNKNNYHFFQIWGQILNKTQKTCRRLKISPFRVKLRQIWSHWLPSDDTICLNNNIERNEGLRGWTQGVLMTKEEHDAAYLSSSLVLVLLSCQTVWPDLAKFYKSLATFYKALANT